MFSRYMYPKGGSQHHLLFMELVLQPSCLSLAEFVGGVRHSHPNTPQGS